MQEERPIEAHNECMELLPWLVNGSLSEEQNLRLRTHLQSCAECRGDFAEQTEVRDRMQRADTVVYAPQISLQKLMARIEEPLVATHQHEPQQPTLAARPRPHRWLVAAVLAEAIGIGLLAGTLLWKNGSEQTAPRFATLTSSPAANTKDPTVRIVFAPAASSEEINTLVRSVSGQIVAGPSEADVYTLTLPADKDAAAVSAEVARLRGNPRVRFAEVVVHDFGQAR